MRESAWLLVACIAAVIAGVLPSTSAPAVMVIDARSATAVSAAHLPAGSVLTVDAVPSVSLERVFEYDDSRYARGRGMSDRFANGLPIHLKAALAYRGIDARIGRVDADGLRQVLSGAAQGVCVIVPGGILPGTVRTKGRDAMRSFLMRGGTVIWAGAPFDLFYSTRGVDGTSTPVSAADPTAWPQLYSSSGPLDAHDRVDSPPLHHGTIEAPLDRATGLTYDATPFDVDARRLGAIGGAPLAYIDSVDDSSVSQLPIGRGRVVIFGDAFADEMDAAREIAQVVATGAWFAPRDVRVVASLDSSRIRASIDVPRGHHVFAFGEAPFYFPFGY
ncbi:MAG: hypothetical protein ACHQY2_02330 [Candidatus Eremiobacterales bacterium]